MFKKPPYTDSPSCSLSDNSNDSPSLVRQLQKELADLKKQLFDSQSGKHMHTSNIVCIKLMYFYIALDDKTKKVNHSPMQNNVKVSCIV